MKHLTVRLFLIVWCVQLHSQTAPSVSPIFSVGEELDYAVRWKFLRLGTITIRTLSDSSSPHHERVRVVMRVESSPRIPFIFLWEYNEAVMDAVRLHSLRYSAIHVLNDKEKRLHHTFHEQERTVTTECLDVSTQEVERHAVHDVDWYVEGTSLFFLARDAARRGATVTAPTVVAGSVSDTRLHFAPTTENISIDAWDHPVCVRRFSGEAGWTGATAAGMSGEFTGWVSADEASVVLRAEVTISLGSITIELEKWNRKDWTPPSAKGEPSS